MFKQLIYITTIKMLRNNPKVNLWGCTVCSNYHKKSCNDEESEVEYVEGLKEKGILTGEEANFFSDLGILEPIEKTVDYCLLARKKISSLRLCPIGLTNIKAAVESE